MGVIKGEKSKSANAYNWDLCHKIINTVRYEMRLPLSERKNPYVSTEPKAEAK